MASLLSPRRNRGDIDLAASEPTVVIGSAGPTELPTLAWLTLAAGAGLISVLSGWVLVTGLVVAGWLAAEPGTLGQALSVGTQLWLLANGGGATLGSTSVTLVPWGVTGLVAWLVARTAGYAARQGPAGSPTVTPMVCIVATLGYLAPLLAVALLVGGPWPALRSGMVMLVVVPVAAAWGCCHARQTWPTASWPAWSRAVPRAVLAALLLMFAGGAAVLAIGLAVNLDRVTALLTTLDAGIIGNVALLVGQLAYAPNAIVWAACYALGPGFTLGNGSLVSPAATELGALPSIPMLAAVPDVGPGGISHLWWLALGVVAGAVAATLVVLARPSARYDETALVGGLSGAVAGGAFALVAWATSGDLGSDLLSGVGPELVPVLVMATSTMGLSGALCGLVLGLWRRRPKRPSSRSKAAVSSQATGKSPVENAEPAEEATVALTRRSRGGADGSGAQDKDSGSHDIDGGADEPTQQIG
ncbi:MAG: DUF6350 family protein [Microlunatus sp.]